MVCILCLFVCHLFFWLLLPNFLLSFFLIWDPHPETISDRLRIFFCFFFWLIYTASPTKVSSIQVFRGFFIIERSISHSWYWYQPLIPTGKYGWYLRLIQSILKKISRYRQLMWTHTKNKLIDGRYRPSKWTKTPKNSRGWQPASQCKHHSRK